MNPLQYRAIAGAWGDLVTIEDAPLNAIVKVNRSDSVNGKAFDPQSCTLALAITRSLGADHCLCFRSTTYVLRGTKALRYINSRPLRREIITKTDHGIPPLPGSYLLRAPRGSERMGEAFKRKVAVAEARASGERPAGTRTFDYRARTPQVSRMGRFVRSLNEQ